MTLMIHISSHHIRPITSSPRPPRIPLRIMRFDTDDRRDENARLADMFRQ